jgi:ABC-2 type transport system ATP-binding protein
MPAVEVVDVVKTYGDRNVVDKVSFSVEQGQILGLIGPNGAGKTTAIRMIMDIIKPDAGEVRILGKTFGEESKDLVGYLPEERGLYKRMTVLDTLAYFGSLKGIKPADASARAEKWLKRVNLNAHQRKKMEELSHGMAQLVQIVSTLLHDPKLLIFDEPFTGLDPVNMQLVKEIIADLRKEGKAIILSTHRMNEVEELCDSVFMINKGRGVLQGRLADIKKRFRGNTLAIESDSPLGNLSGISSSKRDGLHTDVVMADGTTPAQIMQQLVAQRAAVTRFEVTTPSLNDIFIRIAGENQ